MIKGKDIQKFLHKPKPTLLDVDYGQVTEALKSDLKKLGLLNHSIANRDTAFKTLCETHGDNAGIYYFGLLMSKMNKSRKQIKQSMKTHPRSLDRKLKKIVDAGIPLTLTEREEQLPPLNISVTNLS
jgi:hypothetical protein